MEEIKNETLENLEKNIDSLLADFEQKDKELAQLRQEIVMVKSENIAKSKEIEMLQNTLNSRETQSERIARKIEEKFNNRL